jgi:N-acetylneuraminic acid mutarotase
MRAHQSVCLTALLTTLLLSGACSDDTTTPPADAAPPVDGVADTGGPGSEASVDGPGGDSVTDTIAPDTKPKPPAKWDKAADMLEARSWHSATLLKDGTVLVAGGTDSNAGLQSAERYDHTKNSWSAAGKMSEPHWHHRAELLDSGKVLIIGGCSSGQSYVCMNGVGVDLYDPANTTTPWTKATPMLASRRSHCSTKLKDGRILIAGGYNSSKNHTGLEIYDPKLGTWSSPIAVLSSPRNLGTCTTLANGKVLLAGGYDGTKFLNTLELFDPVGGTIQVLTAKLKEARDTHTATLLPNGQVLLVGGYCKNSSSSSCQVSTAEIYDPVSNKILPGGSPGTATYAHEATLLTNGQVLVTGGTLTDKVAKLFTGSGWSQTVYMKTGRERHAAARLSDGRVIVTGGEPGSSWYGQTSVEIYTP